MKRRRGLTGQKLLPPNEPVEPILSARRHKRVQGRRLIALVALCLAAAPGLSFAQPMFVNVTTAAGLNHNTIPPNCPSCAPTFAQEQSGGAAAGDFDGDGWVDLFVTRYFDSDLLYRNNGDGAFSDATAAAFPGGIGVHETNGAAWGDVDNDGDLDLAVATLNESRHLLYINNGAGQFAEEGAMRGVLVAGGPPTTQGTSFSMGDYDRDGYLDMYVTEWRGFGATAPPVQARLFRNRGAAAPGHFIDVTAAAGVGLDLSTGPHAGQSLSFTPRFADFDRDGLPDLAVASDGGTSRLFWNNGDGTFSDGTTAAGINTGTNDMGLTTADFNGDGLLDWFVTSIGHGSGIHPSGNRLFLNNGDRTFADATYAAGVREGGWGWGAEALDFDNDGDLDIAHTNGMGVWETDQTRFFYNLGSRTNPQYANLAGPLGVTDAGFGRGLLTLDYDRDGDQDMLIVNYASPPILYRNDGGNAKDWLEVRTVGASSNRDGVGAYLKVTPDLGAPDVYYVAEITASSTYLAQSEMVAHFGLGDVAIIDQIDIAWPSGYTQSFTDVAPNQRITIAEGLVADFDGDDDVDMADLARWTSHAGMTGGAAPSLGDANRDGDVDGADFLVWQRELGRTVESGLSVSAPAQAAVPEASGLALVAAAIALTASRNGFRRATPRGAPRWPSRPR
jgi:hypothetical protein